MFGSANVRWRPRSCPGVLPNRDVRHLGYRRDRARKTAVTTKQQALPPAYASSREGSRPFRWSADRCRADPARPLAQSLIGPAYRRVMAILPRIVPAHPMVRKGAGRSADRERQLVGRDRMAGRGPDFLV